MTRWIIYSVRTTEKGVMTTSIEKAPIRPSDNPHIVCQWRGVTLLGVQYGERKAETFRRLVELQGALQAFDVETV
jgi:hypothetical protein